MQATGIGMRHGPRSHVALGHQHKNGVFTLNFHLQLSESTQYEELDPKTCKSWGQTQSPLLGATQKDQAKQL